MGRQIRNPNLDPFNNDLPAGATSGSYIFRSVFYSGTYENLIAPEQNNFPVDTKTRLFLYLPIIPDITDFSTKPFNLYNVSDSQPMTRVTGDPNSAANQYRIAPLSSLTPEVVELNTGLAGKEIGFTYFVQKGSTLQDYDVQAKTGSIATPLLKKLETWIFPIGSRAVTEDENFTIQIATLSEDSLYNFFEKTLTVRAVMRDDDNIVKLFSGEGRLKGEQNDYGVSLERTAVPGIISVKFIVKSEWIKNGAGTWTGTGFNRGYIIIEKEA